MKVRNDHLSGLQKDLVVTHFYFWILNDVVGLGSNIEDYQWGAGLQRDRNCIEQKSDGQGVPLVQRRPARAS